MLIYLRYLDIEAFARVGFYIMLQAGMQITRRDMPNDQ